jgi:hypothetical protein
MLALQELLNQSLGLLPNIVQAVENVYQSLKSYPFWIH